jgi:prepilin-type N-terminal cleavage/methylation domain-containing protein
MQDTESGVALAEWRTIATFVKCRAAARILDGENIVRRSEAGFTLIELVIVLVILGILSAVAIPKFQDFSTDAKTAAEGGGTSAVASALAIATANLKRAPTGSEIAGYLTGATCSGSVMQIGSGSSYVKVSLGVTCATTVTALGTASYTTGT